MELNLWFIVGFLIYVIIFAFIYYHSKLKGRNLKTIKFEERDKILRWTLVALIFSLCWLLFRPIWFPVKSPIKYDYYRLILLLMVIIATLNTYILYRRGIK